VDRRRLHTGDLARFDGGTDDHTDGAFAVLQQVLTPPTGSESAETAMLLQWGVADGDVAEVEGHFGAGIVSTVPLRDGLWRTGLYVSHANLTDDPGAGLGADELAIELFNEIPLTPAIVLAPDLQLIVDPTGRNDIGDAWVVTLRLVISL
jgi:carbohydrate-selective porin OprB